jgi:CDP-diacylglycerol--glycerol-3-phosphate 3-phosphatidyltransferase
MLKHVPNALSLARIALTPVFLVLFLSGTFTGQGIALVLFILLAISDWLDGAIARRYGVGSRFGMYLDPLADKVLVLGAFVAILFLPADQQGRLLYTAWWWIPVVAIALRDFAVTGLRTWADRRGTPVQTRGGAKAKTAVQLTFLIAFQVFLVATHLRPFGGWGQPVADFADWVLYSPIPDLLLVFTALLTVWTGAAYFRRPPTAATAATPP